MNKVKVYVSFRYESETIIDIDEDYESYINTVRAQSEEVKQETLNELNFYYSVDDDGIGIISDWKVEVERVE